MLTLPTDVLDEVVDLAQAAGTNEVCGIIAGPAGQPADGKVTADRVIPIGNTAADPARAFVFDAADLLAAYAEMDASGEDPVVLYHSHPGGPASPSPTDVAGAAGGTSLWLIVATKPTPPDVRCWSIVDGHVTEVDILVVDHEPRPTR